ncbi:hypothetical protein B0T14DRAFT_527298 [Immersiella caudata]|uniref:Uncharacterized protein n=1 Tax=Immersiella caudata TaxID=314043 RepID=A0AA40BU93_9PEZI|nr:hypothetical protein B0T14DRAFT_527298 [Immersiella caudata]
MSQSIIYARTQEAVKIRVRYCFLPQWSCMIRREGASHRNLGHHRCYHCRLHHPSRQRLHHKQLPGQRLSWHGNGRIRDPEFRPPSLRKLHQSRGLFSVRDATARGRRQLCVLPVPSVLSLDATVLTSAEGSKSGRRVLKRQSSESHSAAASTSREVQRVMRCFRLFKVVDLDLFAG